MTVERTSENLYFSRFQAFRNLVRRLEKFLIDELKSSWYSYLSKFMKIVDELGSFDGDEKLYDENWPYILINLYQNLWPVCHGLQYNQMSCVDRIETTHTDIER